MSRGRALAAIALGALVLLAGQPGANAQTVLHLAETASVPAKPDELAASIRAEATLPNAAAAQQRVNALMADALDRAHRVPGITASTGRYTVWRQPPNGPQDRTERWQATQALELHGADGAAVLRLVGELQQLGLAVSGLEWRLSREASRAARQQALADAIKALRGRADAAAELLGLQFDQFKEVRLDTPRPAPFPRAALAAGLAASAPVPPSAEAEEVMVSATAEADVLLRPKGHPGSSDTENHSTAPRP